MRIAILKREQPIQLAVDHLDQLTHGIVQLLECRRNLLHLVCSRNGAQRDAIFLRNKAVDQTFHVEFPISLNLNNLLDAFIPDRKNQQFSPNTIHYYKELRKFV